MVAAEAFGQGELHSLQDLELVTPSLYPSSDVLDSRRLVEAVDCALAATAGELQKFHVNAGLLGAERGVRHHDIENGAAGEWQLPDIG